VRIALVSYEFPPATALGGIATYVDEVSRALVQAGAEVEVFCGGSEATEALREGRRIHQVPGTRAQFPVQVAERLATRHRQRPFTVMEGPDYLAEAWECHEAAPELPYVVKLHTPTGLMPRLQSRRPGDLALVWLRRRWFELKMGRRLPPAPESAMLARERRNAASARRLVAPSEAIAQATRRLWRLPATRYSLVPYPYAPDRAWLDLSIPDVGQGVVFWGRLEYRKGVDVLAAAWPQVRRAVPEATLALVGSDAASPRAGKSMANWLQADLGLGPDMGVTWLGPRRRVDLPATVAGSAVAVFPSRWESFGYVALEAMAGGRAVVCSSGSGLAELVGQGRWGTLVPPGQAAPLASALIALLQDPERRRRLAEQARLEALIPYAPATIAKLQLADYEAVVRAI